MIRKLVKSRLSNSPRFFNTIRKFKFKIEYFLSARLRSLYTENPYLVVFDEFQSRVHSGPFKGMRYIKESYGSDLIPKLLGTYEKELFVVVNEVITKKYDEIINIGAAEGYYAVGFAYRLKAAKTKIIAYELNDYATSLIKKLAALNGVFHKIQNFGEAQLSNIKIDKHKNTFIICDIEGYEINLINPKINSLFLTCDLLVEIHDNKDESTILNTLSERFRKTHEIQLINYTPRTKDDIKNLKWIKDPYFKLELISEHRTRGLKWIYITRK